MAGKTIRWSIRAQQDRLQILEYWINRNKSNTYAKKLYLLFNSAIDLISSHPEIGKPTNKENVKIKVVKDYLVIYQIQPESIDILTIWDSRQDPKNIERFIG